jgi:acetyl esterase/lipase
MFIKTIETGLEVAKAEQLPARLYRDPKALRSAPLVLHLHGGAFCNGSVDEYRTIPILLAEAGAVVVSAEYPLAPMQQFPGSLQTLFAALKSLHATRDQWAGKSSRLFVAGEEAGGNLAASLALMARDQRSPTLTGQILLSPMLDPCLATTSVRQADAGAAGCKWADGWQHYLGSADKASHPYAAPLGATRLAGVAPALIVTAQDDPMRDESLSYADRLQKSGVFVRSHVLPAPTAWPSALCCCDRASQDWASEDWAKTLRHQFVQFFADCAARLRRTASPQLIPV